MDRLVSVGRMHVNSEGLGMCVAAGQTEVTLQFFRSLTKKTFQLLWSGHAPPYSQRIFASPLMKLLLHLLHLRWVQGPQAALPRGVAILVLHLLKAFVQREVVSDRILPAVRCCLKVWEMLCHEAVDFTHWKAPCFAVPQSQEDKDTVGVDWFRVQWLRRTVLRCLC